MITHRNESFSEKKLSDLEELKMSKKTKHSFKWKAKISTALAVIMLFGTLSNVSVFAAQTSSYNDPADN